MFRRSMPKTSIVEEELTERMCHLPPSPTLHWFSLCHKATQDLEDQAREEKRLKAYTELASTLSKVSASAANLVMPALADILLKHAQCKQRADDNFKSIAKVWEEVFDTCQIRGGDEKEP
ncbi:hypothetical protein L208DRAFT_1404222 [Tricholoma matsutake]|nr:hypothetical protein L208DRAFT_1404222 [Tricholoma matsutake 945]